MTRSSLLASVLAFGMAPCLMAHSVHQSTAEARYDSKTKWLEVSLTVFVDDLEVALVRQCEREMRLDKTPEAEFDEQVQLYLSRHFKVTNASGKEVPLDWVGRESDQGSAKSDEPTVTLFFQLSLPAGLEEVTLRHALFSGMFKDQVNLLLLRDDKRKEQMRFTQSDGAKKLALTRD